MTYHQAIILSPLGKILIEGSDKGISRVSFWKEDTQGEPSQSIPECLKECTIQLAEYFNGSRKEFDLKLDLGDAPQFHKDVWKMVKLIPYGRTRTYGEIAEIIDHQNAFRAVGHANGLNPLPIVVPCHRVIGKDGSLTGYAYGLEMKRWLLSHESPGYYMKQGDLVDALSVY
ncbi:MAG: methylated-DNA--[protein]-cysteine S-methyltransferase [Saprospiraceae bacterium]